MEQTSIYNLNQWVADDRILREDFNADNVKIEAALAGAGDCHIISGSWVGNGQGDGKSGVGQTVTLPATPKFMIIFGYYTDSSSSKPLVAFVTHDKNFCMYSSSPTYDSSYIRLIDNRLELTFRNFLNSSGVTQNYLLFT